MYTPKKFVWLLYRMKNAAGEIVYIGKTMQAIENRMKQHFTGKGYLKKWTESIETIEFAVCTTMADQNVYEVWYIGKLQPKYNAEYRTTDIVTVSLPELAFSEWTGWQVMKTKLLKRKVASKQETTIWAR
jgi:hypothetical protein